MGHIGNWIVATAILAVGLGLLFPWISRIGLGRLPGDIVIEREDFQFYYPLTSAILISVAISAIIWLVFRA